MFATGSVWLLVFALDPTNEAVMSYFSDYGRADASLSKLFGEEPKPTSVSPSKPKRPKRKSQTESSGIRWTWSADMCQQISKRNSGWFQRLSYEEQLRLRKISSDVHKGKVISATTRARIMRIQNDPQVRAKINTPESRAKRSATMNTPVMTYYGVFPSRRAVAEAAGVSCETVRLWMKRYPEYYYYLGPTYRQKAKEAK